MFSVPHNYLPVPRRLVLDIRMHCPGVITCPNPDRLSVIYSRDRILEILEDGVLVPDAGCSECV
jgi:hypothetical protein